MMDDMVMTPTECVALINQTLEVAYRTVVVSGEVNSFKVSRDKYVFFDVKDENVTLSCFMMAYQLRIPLEDGMKVKILAEPRLTRWGKFSMNVRQVVPVGEGTIKRAFELLKAKLDAEGLLAPERKRALPRIPARIGIISSVESAGYADFIKILNARWGGVDVVVANVQVQGMSAVEQNVAAMTYFNQMAEPVEVLVVIRGGGSAEDLAVYNDEHLVRAIAGSRIPTLVGVGHEVDTSLADLVADVRAATPSNAAQIVVPDRRELLAEVRVLKGAIDRTLALRIENYKRIILDAQRTYLRSLDISTLKLRLGQAVQRLNMRQDALLERQKELLGAYRRTLRQLDPRAVLQRGYALVRLENGAVLSGQLPKKGDVLRIEQANSIITSEVKDAKQKG